MCSIEDCQATPVAGGLCAKHYMRLRRTGDAMKTGQSGRPSRGGLDAKLHIKLRRMFPDWSKQTQYRYIRAYRTLTACEGEAAAKAAVSASTRPNGGVNVSAFERQAELAIFNSLRTSRKAKVAAAVSDTELT